MKKSKKAGFLKVRGGIIPFDTLVCLGVTREQILEKIKKDFVYTLSKEEDEQLQMFGEGRTVRMEGGWTVLWVKKFPTSPQVKNHLAHEIFHVVDFTLRCMGIKLSADSNEIYAYYTGWLTEQIYEAFSL